MREYSIIKGITKLEVSIFFNFGAPRQQKQKTKKFEAVTKVCCTYPERSSTTENLELNLHGDSNWRASEASETLSGVYKFELVRYIYICMEVRIHNVGGVMSLPIFIRASSFKCSNHWKRHGH